MKKLSKQITLGIDPFSGKRIRKRIYATSKPGLDQAEKDAIREFAKHGIVSDMTYKDYEDRWYQAQCSTLSPATQKSYKSILRKNKALHHKKMSQIIRSDLQGIINENWNHPETCKRYAFLMASVWRSAAFDGVVEKNIAEGLKRPKTAKSERRPLTEKELEAIRKAPFDQDERFIVDLLFQFGLRPQEAFALDKSSFNRKDRTLTINKGLSHRGETPFIKSTKTGVTRVLPVPDSFWAKIPKLKSLYYFTDPDGQLLTRDKMNRFKRSVLDKINVQMGGTDKIKVTDMTFYTFRHHKASLIYYLSGISLKKKAEYMGHSEEMFLRTYSHMMEEKEDIEVLRQEVI